MEWKGQEIGLHSEFSLMSALAASLYFYYEELASLSLDFQRLWGKSPFVEVMKGRMKESMT